MSLGLYLFRIPNFNKYYFNMELSQCDEMLFQKVNSQRFLENQWHVLISNLIVRRLLSTELNTSPERLEFSIDTYGKPHLQNWTKHFNISHSKNITILATDDDPIGVDIEYEGKLDDLENLISEFSEWEREEFVNLDQSLTKKLFYKLWVLKESYVKAIGKGLSCPLNSFSIRANANPPILIEKKPSWIFKTYAPFEEYQCAVCSKNPKQARGPTIIQAEDILGI